MICKRYWKGKYILCYPQSKNISASLDTPEQKTMSESNREPNALTYQQMDYTQVSVGGMNATHKRGKA